MERVEEGARLHAPEERHLVHVEVSRRLVQAPGGRHREGVTADSNDSDVEVSRHHAVSVANFQSFAVSTDE